MACFHSEGTLPRESDISKRAERDGAKTSAHSFNNVADMPSGPVAFVVHKPDNRLHTSSTETTIESRQSGCVEGVFGAEAIDGEFGWKTEAKYVLKASALSRGVERRESPKIIVSGSEDFLDLHLKKRQKALGLSCTDSASPAMYSRFFFSYRTLNVTTQFTKLFPVLTRV